MNKSVKYWEIGGIFFIFLFGALLHFLFEWSGESRLVGAFVSVNESVWEHFKQGFWPLIVYSVIEYRFIRRTVNNFFVAKACAAYLIPIITGLVFYGYTFIIGEEILIVDITIFLVAIIAGQYASYKILTLPRELNISKVVPLFFIIILGVVLILTTYLPPHLPIFLDGNSATYGLP